MGFYLEDRERTLDSPTGKIMLSLTAFADELEHEEARQRTYDAMIRKARAGHVTGGRVFGYENVRVDTGGVRRVIFEPEAAIVSRIFELAASGQRAVGRPRTIRSFSIGDANAAKPSRLALVGREPKYLLSGCCGVRSAPGSKRAAVRMGESGEYPTGARHTPAVAVLSARTGKVSASSVEQGLATVERELTNLTAAAGAVATSPRSSPHCGIARRTAGS